MILRCPCCGASLSLDALAANADARAVLELAFRATDTGAKVLGYLGCFRPRARSLGWARALRIVEDLTATMRSGVIRRHGHDHWIVEAAWGPALDAVVEARDAGRLRLPLKDHNYLFEVAIRESARLGEQAERRRDEELRRHARSGPAPEEPARADPALVRHHLDKMRATLGRPPKGESC